MALQWYLLFCFAVLGAVVGSFLNVCIYRLPWEKSIVWPGSHCPKCLRPVRARDNIPILSWFLLRGRCRDCGERFSPRYAILEACTACLFGLVFWLEVVQLQFGLGRYFYHVVLVSALIVATFIDLDLQIIPDSVTIPVTLFGLVGGPLFRDAHLRPIDAWAADPAPAPAWDLCVNVSVIVTGWGLWVFGLMWLLRRRDWRVGAAELLLLAASFVYLGCQSLVWVGSLLGAAPAFPGWSAWFTRHPHLHGFTTSLIGLLVGAGIIELVRVAGCAILRKEAMGFGDVTMTAMIGAFLGWQPVVVVFCAAPFFGLVTGLFQWILKGERAIPYGPYLALAGILAMLLWDEIWSLVQLHFQLLAMIPVHWPVLLGLPLLVWCLIRAGRVELESQAVPES